MKYQEKIDSEYFQIKQNTLSDAMTPLNFCIETNSKKPNININLISCKEQILFGLLRLKDKDMNYHIKDPEKRLIDFIYGRHIHEKLKEFNAELILNSKVKDSFDFDKNFKQNKNEICKFYSIANNLSDTQIKKEILEKINLSFLR
jgi:hypothetical protein